jgi:hypothetical protein
MDTKPDPKSKGKAPNDFGVGKVIQLLLASTAFLEALRKLIEALH